MYKVDAVGISFSDEVSDGSQHIKSQKLLWIHMMTGELLWLKADENVAHGGGNVSRWGDARALATRVTKTIDSSTKGSFLIKMAS